MRFKFPIILIVSCTLFISCNQIEKDVSEETINFEEDKLFDLETQISERDLYITDYQKQVKDLGVHINEQNTYIDNLEKQVVNLNVEVDELTDILDSNNESLSITDNESLYKGYLYNDFEFVRNEIEIDFYHFPEDKLIEVIPTGTTIRVISNVIFKGETWLYVFYGDNREIGYIKGDAKFSILEYKNPDLSNFVFTIDGLTLKTHLNRIVGHLDDSYMKVDDGFTNSISYFEYGNGDIDQYDDPLFWFTIDEYSQVTYINSRSKSVFMEDISIGDTMEKVRGYVEKYKYAETPEGNSWYLSNDDKEFAMLIFSEIENEYVLDRIAVSLYALGGP